VTVKQKLFRLQILTFVFFACYVSDKAVSFSDSFVDL